MSIPVYIINLKEREDRLSSVLSEYKDREGFNISITEAIKHTNGAVGLWMTMRRIVESAILNNFAYIILCEDDHVFTEDYGYSQLQNAIEKASLYELDVLLGGASWATDLVKVDEQLFWIKHFSGTQFVVMFRRFYETFLNMEITSSHTVDWAISTMTENKMVLFPFISIQKEFGYSDATQKNNNDGRVTFLFDCAIRKFSQINKAHERINRKQPI